MNLRTKTFVIIFTLVILSILLNFAVFNVFVSDSFEAMEREKAINDLDRCKTEINKEMHQLGAHALQWALSKDILDLIEYNEFEWVNSKLEQESLAGYNIDMAYVYNLHGKKIWGRLYDFDKQVEMSITEFQGNYLPTQHILLKHNRNHSSIGGLRMTEHGPMVVASHPIVSNRPYESIVGTVILGRLLKEKQLKSISNHINVDCHILATDKNVELLENIEGDYYLENSINAEIEELDENWLKVSRKLFDIDMIQSIVLQATVHREITLNSHKTRRYVMASVSFVGLIMLLSILILLRLLVDNPTKKLTGQLSRIGKTEDFSSFVPSEKNDEIGQLSREFKIMIDKLSDAQEKLMEQSYKSGMAETIINGLHVIRNILFPMNASVYNIEDFLKTIHVSSIAKALGELEQNELSDKRRTKLLEYLSENMKLFRNFKVVWKEEQVSLTANLQKIDDILISQEHISMFERVYQEVDLYKILKNIQQSNVFLKNNIEIRISADIEAVATIRSDKLRIVQILKSIFYYMSFVLPDADSVERIDVYGKLFFEEKMESVKLQFIDSNSSYDIENLAQFYSDTSHIEYEGEKLPNLHWIGNTVNSMGGKLEIARIEAEKGIIVSLVLPLDNMVYEVGK